MTQACDLTEAGRRNGADQLSTPEGGFANTLPLAPARGSASAWANCGRGARAASHRNAAPAAKGTRVNGSELRGIPFHSEAVEYREGGIPGVAARVGLSGK